VFWNPHVLLVYDVVHPDRPFLNGDPILSLAMCILSPGRDAARESGDTITTRSRSAKNGCTS